MSAQAIPTPGVRPGHSTGPRTPEGKEIVSQNARKHGLTAKILAVSQDELPIFQSLRDELLTYLGPVSEIEHQLFDMMLAAQWHLRRIEILESEALTTADLDDPKVQAKLRLLATYRSRHTNTWFRAHRAITREINDRIDAEMAQEAQEAARQEEAEFEEAVEATVSAHMANLYKQTPSAGVYRPVSQAPLLDYNIRELLSDPTAASGTRSKGKK